MVGDQRGHSRIQSGLVAWFGGATKIIIMFWFIHIQLGTKCHVEPTTNHGSEAECFDRMACDYAHAHSYARDYYDTYPIIFNRCFDHTVP